VAMVAMQPSIKNGLKKIKNPYVLMAVVINVLTLMIFD
jgi:hypothetical protein